jgi:hypothetical protein
LNSLATTTTNRNVPLRSSKNLSRASSPKVTATTQSRAFYAVRSAQNSKPGWDRLWNEAELEAEKTCRIIWNTTGCLDNSEDSKNPEWCEKWGNHLLGVLLKAGFNKDEMEYKSSGKGCIILYFKSKNTADRLMPEVKELMQEEGFEPRGGELGRQCFYRLITGPPLTDGS